MVTLKSTDEQLLAFIGDYCDTYGYSPSVRDISRHFGYSSPSTVKHMLDRLRDEGRVTFLDKQPRTVRVVNNGKQSH